MNAITTISSRLELRQEPFKTNRTRRFRNQNTKAPDLQSEQPERKSSDALSLEVQEFIRPHLDTNAFTTQVLATIKPTDLDRILPATLALINTARINDVRYINKFLHTVNKQLSQNGIYVGCVETLDDRATKRYKLIPVLRQLVTFMEFFFMRFCPKVIGLKKIYFAITRGRNRQISKAEILGRLVCCGFSILDCQPINGKHYFIVRREKDPILQAKPSYGPLYRMKRLGKDGKIIGVFKFRTMHPYSEYLHDYILQQNGYADSGKPKDDFRLTSWGKIFRRYWLDEIPQILNVLTGDMKLVGVRPVSQRYFQDIPAHIQQLRIGQKPGCIPPYVALNRKSTVKSVLGAEEMYLRIKLKHPATTDTRLFFLAFYNIIVKRKRSA